VFADLDELAAHSLRRIRGRTAGGITKNQFMPFGLGSRHLMRVPGPDGTDTGDADEAGR